MSNDTRYAIKLTAYWMSTFVIIPIYLVVGAVRGVMLGAMTWWKDAQDAEPINWRGT